MLFLSFVAWASPARPQGRGGAPAATARPPGPAQRAGGLAVLPAVRRHPLPAPQRGTGSTRNPPPTRPATAVCLQVIAPAVAAGLPGWTYHPPPPRPIGRAWGRGSEGHDR